MSCVVIDGKTVLILTEEDPETGCRLSGYYFLWNSPLFKKKVEKNPFKLLRSEINRYKSAKS